MAWGGSLNKEGSNHIRKLREADKVIGFLENFKESLNTLEKEHISKTIDIITEHVAKISEKND